MRDSTWQEKHIMSGRLVSDTYLNAKEFLRQQTSYGLVELIKNQFNREIRSVLALHCTALHGCNVLGGADARWLIGSLGLAQSSLAMCQC
jgi:hypothetical protein